jgi:hypothetical protein
MTERDRQIAAHCLAEIDKRRAELELVASTYSPQDVRREEIEHELAALWRARLAVTEGLNQLPPRAA